MPDPVRKTRKKSIKNKDIRYWHEICCYPVNLSNFWSTGMKLATKTITAWVGALALAVLTPLTASANLVSNPGFELTGGGPGSGLFTDWVDSANIFDGSPIFHTGARSALFLNDIIDPLDTLSQTLTGLTVGDTYDFSFWLRCDGQAGNNLPCEDANLSVLFSVLIGIQSTGLGSFVRTEGVAGDNGFDMYSVSFKAIAAGPVLTFESSSYPDSVYLDDVSLERRPLPEPGSLLLVGLGLAAAAAIRRRKPA